VKVAWDEAKNLSNRAKHGASFAALLFTSGVARWATKREQDHFESFVENQR
jgi:uncharacterized DUF497 family protein